MSLFLKTQLPHHSGAFELDAMAEACHPSMQARLPGKTRHNKLGNNYRSVLRLFYLSAFGEEVWWGSLPLMECQKKILLVFSPYFGTACPEPQRPCEAEVLDQNSGPAPESLP